MRSELETKLFVQPIYNFATGAGSQLNLNIWGYECFMRFPDQNGNDLRYNDVGWLANNPSAQATVAVALCQMAIKSGVPNPTLNIDKDILVDSASMGILGQVVRIAAKRLHKWELKESEGVLADSKVRAGVNKLRKKGISWILDDLNHEHHQKDDVNKYLMWKEVGMVKVFTGDGMSMDEIIEWTVIAIERDKLVVWEAIEKKEVYMDLVHKLIAVNGKGKLGIDLKKVLIQGYALGRSRWEATGSVSIDKNNVVKTGITEQNSGARPDPVWEKNKNGIRKSG